MQQKVLLKYGENPHQSAVWMQNGTSFVTGHHQLSFNDVRNLNLGYALLRQFSLPTTIIVKHVNIAGLSTAPSYSDRLQQAIDTDPRAAQNGWVICNHSLTTTEIEETMRFPFDGIAIMDVVEGGHHRVLSLTSPVPGVTADASTTELIHLCDGTMLIQDRFRSSIRTISDFKLPVDAPVFSKDFLHDALIAWRITCSIKTNCAVLVRAGRTLAVAAGHQDGVTAIEHAIYKARTHARNLEHGTVGAILAVDGNFPHEIPRQQLVEAGIRVFVLPGLAKNDQALLDAFSGTSCSVLFTNERCFQH